MLSLMMSFHWFVECWSSFLDGFLSRFWTLPGTWSVCKYIFLYSCLFWIESYCGFNNCLPGCIQPIWWIMDSSICVDSLFSMINSLSLLFDSYNLNYSLLVQYSSFDLLNLEFSAFLHLLGTCIVLIKFQVLYRAQQRFCTHQDFFLP